MMLEAEVVLTSLGEAATQLDTSIDRIAAAAWALRIRGAERRDGILYFTADDVERIRFFLQENPI